MFMHFPDKYISKDHCQRTLIQNKISIANCLKVTYVYRVYVLRSKYV